MWNVFWLHHASFTLYAFGLLVMWAIAWLYFDAYLGMKRWWGLCRVAGFLVLGTGLALGSMVVEFGGETGWVAGISHWQVAVRLLGYGLILIGVLGEPLQKTPGDTSKELGAGWLPGIAGGGGITLATFLPVCAGLAGLAYWRRATLGLERHLTNVGSGFFWLAGFELLGLLTHWRETTIVWVYQLVAPYGLAWLGQRVLLLMALMILGKWVFYYLLKRLFTQMVLLFSLMALGIFVGVAVGYSSLMVGVMEKQIVSRLESEVGVLAYIIEQKLLSALTSAQALANNPQLQGLSEVKNYSGVMELLRLQVSEKGFDAAMVVNENGMVLARGEEPERFGDSVSNDFLVARVLEGKAVTGVAIEEGIVAGELVIKAGVPMEMVGGGVVLGERLDTVFTDGLAAASGMEIGFVINETIGAASITDGAGNRIGGTKFVEGQVWNQVVGEGVWYGGRVRLAEGVFLAGMAPVGQESGRAGAVFTAIPEASVFAALVGVLQLSLVLALGMLVAVLPLILVFARYIERQVR